MVNREEGGAMTEAEFWRFMERGWERGRLPMVAARPPGGEDPAVRQGGEYLEGHGFLFAGYDRIPVETVAGMGDLLLEVGVGRETKEAVMILLAHHGCDEALGALVRYLERPDPELRLFAEIALSECVIWNGERR